MKKIVLILALGLLSAASFAATIDQVKTANCVSEKGSYLQLDVEKSIVEVNLGKLGVMTNLADGERMPVEVSSLGGEYDILVGLVFNNKKWGSISLVAKSEQVLTENEDLMVLFREDTGFYEYETLSCKLTF